MSQQNDSLKTLQTTIAARRHADPADSYVASLFNKGRDKIARKVAEEGLEVAIAAISEGRARVISESADLLFHLLVLCEHEGIAFAEIVDELASREGVSGLEEKASRGKS